MYVQATLRPHDSPETSAGEPFDHLLRTIVNVSSVPLRSPFRYPGGKTWLIPHIRLWLQTQNRRPAELIEPFAGGAAVGLTAIFEGLVDRLTLVEIDPDVSSVWHTILNGDAEGLAHDVAHFEMSVESVRSVLRAEPSSVRERAFATLLKNRVQRGGILAPGASVMKAGENGRGISSRWYPETLRRRILSIAHLRDRITFVQGDGISYIRERSAQPNVVFFIDPPYTVAGRRLYTYSAIDHVELFRVASALQGDLLMTYDSTPEIQVLAERFGFATTQVLMKNTHHAKKAELLVGRDLSWVNVPSGAPLLRASP